MQAGAAVARVSCDTKEGDLLNQRQRPNASAMYSDRSKGGPQMAFLLRFTVKDLVGRLPDPIKTIALVRSDDPMNFLNLK